MEMLEDGKWRFIHQLMKDVIESIRTLFERLATQKNEEDDRKCRNSPGVSDVSFTPMDQIPGGPDTPNTSIRRESSQAATQTRTETRHPGQAVELASGTQRSKNAIE